MLEYQAWFPVSDANFVTHMHFRNDPQRADGGRTTDAKMFSKLLFGQQYRHMAKDAMMDKKATRVLSITPGPSEPKTLFRKYHLSHAWIVFEVTGTTFFHAIAGYRCLDNQLYIYDSNTMHSSMVPWNRLETIVPFVFKNYQDDFERKGLSVDNIKVRYNDSLFFYVDTNFRNYAPSSEGKVVKRLQGMTAANKALQAIPTIRNYNNVLRVYHEFQKQKGNQMSRETNRRLRELQNEFQPPHYAAVVNGKLSKLVTLNDLAALERNTDFTGIRNKNWGVYRKWKLRKQQIEHPLVRKIAKVQESELPKWEHKLQRLRIPNKNLHQTIVRAVKHRRNAVQAPALEKEYKNRISRIYVNDSKVFALRKEFMNTVQPDNPAYPAILKAIQEKENRLVSQTKDMASRAKTRNTIEAILQKIRLSKYQNRYSTVVKNLNNRLNEFHKDDDRKRIQNIINRGIDNTQYKNGERKRIQDILNRGISRTRRANKGYLPR
jgi:hypothetical protein